jgi:hypothetical protein
MNLKHTWLSQMTFDIEEAFKADKTTCILVLAISSRPLNNFELYLVLTICMHVHISHES